MTESAMATAAARPAAQATRYLNKGTVALLAAHHRPQAHRHPLRDHHHVLLLHRRRRGHAGPARTVHAARRLPVTADTYNRLFTFHGIVMVWFFLVPSIPATLGNFLLPLMIGARDVAFPRLNLVQLVPQHRRRHAVTLYALLLGGVDTGWTFYTPFSTMFSNSHVVARRGRRLHRRLLARSRPGVNFIATIHMLRAPGMTWFRLPLFVWAIYATSIVMVLATPVLAMTLLLDRGRAAAAACRSSTRRSAATRCCSSTCSGSTATPPSTS